MFSPAWKRPSKPRLRKCMSRSRLRCWWRARRIWCWCGGGCDKARFEKSDNPAKGVRDHRIVVRKVKTVRLAWIADIFGPHPDRFGEFYEYLALGGGNVAIRLAVQFDQGRQMLDLSHHRVRQAAIHHRQRGDAFVTPCGISGHIAAQ